MPKLNDDFREYFKRKEEKEKKFLQSASLVSLQRRLCLTRQANPIFTQAT